MATKTDLEDSCTPHINIYYDVENVRKKNPWPDTRDVVKGITTTRLSYVFVLEIAPLDYMESLLFFLFRIPSKTRRHS